MIDKSKDWLQKRYELLSKQFTDREFSGDEAKKVLVEIGKVDAGTVPVVISEMKKLGWIEPRLDPKDSRKRNYKLKPLSEIIKESLKVDGETLTKGDIESILKKAADLIRTRVDYKFILILLFLKRISDKWDDETNKAINDLIKAGLKKEQAEKEAKKAAYHEFDLPEDCLWDNLRKEVNELPERFSKALRKLAELNPELKDVLDNAEFIEFTKNVENSEILRQLVELFSEKKLNHVSPDVLGDAYEWILRYFAPDKAKEGEVYTPREVIRLLMEVLKPKEKESMYEPACGSSGMLIVAHKYVEEKYGKAAANKVLLYGQEANHKTLTLGRMNMYIHDIRDVQLAWGDTLLYPKFKDGDSIKQFDVVTANPPWNQDGYDEVVLKKGEFWRNRFKYGFVPGQSADWAWMQHMLASAKEKTGRVGVVMDNGCLFRGGKEKAIREIVLKEDLIEAVLLLPEKLFYNTGAPGAILFFNKNKPANRKDKVLFINASRDFEKHPEVRKLNILADKNIKKIVDAYDNFSEEEGFSKIISFDELKAQEFNMNVSLYVYPEDKQEDIDIDQEFKNLEKIEGEEKGVTTRLRAYLKEVR
jgi:type I restriction enzyme M protein